MAELKNGCPPESATFKEAVCIDAGRVYDSCCDRDCLEDLDEIETAQCDYKQGTASITLKEEVDLKKVKKAISAAGYKMK